jgi:hypothetical protein
LTAFYQVGAFDRYSQDSCLAILIRKLRKQNAVILAQMSAKPICLRLKHQNSTNYLVVVFNF